MAYLMTSMMRSVIDEGTAPAPPRASCGARRPARPAPPTVERDAWFVGFTPDLLAAVWVGFDDMHELGRGETGGRAALPIWAGLHDQGDGGRPTKDFVHRPDRRAADRQGDRPARGARPGTEHLDEVFLDGTAPTKQAAGRRRRDQRRQADPSSNLRRSLAAASERHLS